VRVPDALFSLPYTRSLLVVDLDLEIVLLRVPQDLLSELCALQLALRTRAR
jgi:hypothetical protein